MIDDGINYPQGVQGIVWPAISQGRHVVGICTDKQGKTIAYVPGIVSHLLDQLNYTDLPRGKGVCIIYNVKMFLDYLMLHVMAMLVKYRLEAWCTRKPTTMLFLCIRYSPQ